MKSKLVHVEPKQLAVQDVSQGAVPPLMLGTVVQLLQSHHTRSLPMLHNAGADGIEAEPPPLVVVSVPTAAAAAPTS